MTEQEYQAAQAQLTEMEASLAAAEARETFTPATNDMHRLAHERATRQIAGLRARIAAHEAGLTPEAHNDAC